MRTITLLRLAKKIAALPAAEALPQAQELRERVRAALERGGALAKFQAQPAGFVHSAVSEQPLLTQCNGPAFSMDYVCEHGPYVGSSITFWLLNGGFHATVRLLRFADGNGAASARSEVVQLGAAPLVDALNSYSVEHLATSAVERCLALRLSALQELGVQATRPTHKKLMKNVKRNARVEF